MASIPILSEGDKFRLIIIEELEKFVCISDLNHRDMRIRWIHIILMTIPGEFITHVTEIDVGVVTLEPWEAQNEVDLV